MKEPRSTFLAGLAVILLASLVSAGVQAWRSEVSLTEALATSPVEEAAADALVPLFCWRRCRWQWEQGTHLVFDARSLEEYDQGISPVPFRYRMQTLKSPCRIWWGCLALRIR